MTSKKRHRTTTEDNNEYDGEEGEVSKSRAVEEEGNESTANETKRPVFSFAVPTEKHYRGSIIRRYYPAWQVGHTITKDGKETGISKSFSDKRYGSREKAEAAAIKYKQLKSDELGETYEIPIVKHVPIAIRQFVAGFFDGDGCALLHRRHPNEKRASLKLQITQSYDSGFPPSLQMIQRYYGGRIYAANKATETRRQCYQLQIMGEVAYQMLPHLQEHCILKAPQLHMVARYAAALQDKATPLTAAYTTKAVERLSGLKTLDQYRQVDVDTSRLNAAYVAGLFDAEGCVGIYKGNIAQISQTSSEKLLQAVNSWLGNIGTVSSTHDKLVFSSLSSIKQFLTTIQPFLVVKKDQVDLMLKHLDAPFGQRYAQKQEVSDTLKQLKRV